MSLVGALLWSASERRSRRDEFESTSANVTATLGTLLRRDTDFVATLRGVLTMHPRMTPTLYSTWYSTLQGSTRQPGGIGSAVLSPIPASQLSSFERSRNADPEFRRLIGPWLKRIPAAASPAIACCRPAGA